MDYSNIFAKFISELLNRNLERLEKDFYERTVNELNKLRGERVLARSISNTLKVMLILRLSKELMMLVTDPSKLDVETLPILEKKILLEIIDALKFLEPSQDVKDNAPKTGETSSTQKPGGESSRSPPIVSEVKQEGKTLVFFLKAYPRIIDHDLSLGPFNKGDIAYLPKRLAKELVNSGYVEEIVEITPPESS
ncbi:MAG: hypothetical protein ACP5IE_05290 [Infirmifilum sp.]